jgi:hypothetical protein
MATDLKKTEKTDTKMSKNKTITKLSKVGEWLRSGQSAITVVDMRAVLK